jgi:hypothetical protein
VTNPGYIIGFLSQWKVYLDHIPIGPEAQRFRGKKLDATIFEKVRLELPTPPARTIHQWPYVQLSEEQLSQMYELRQVTKEFWKPVDPRINEDPDSR